MTVGEISDEILSFLQTQSSTLETAASADIRLRALNRARVYLERQRDWSFNYDYVYITVSPNGLVSAAKRVDNDAAASVKKLSKAYWKRGDVDVPIRLISRATEHMEQRAYLDAQPVSPFTQDEMSLPEMEIETGEPRVIWTGPKVTYKPTSTTPRDIRFDAYVWMTDYDDEDNTDYFTQHGHDALFWSALVELNYITTTWSEFEREGDLRPPLTQRDRAIDSLILDDEANEASLG